MSSLTVSVALATFNGCPFLKSQLESIAAQDRIPGEIVIGDDQSSDQTLETIETFSGRHPELTVRVQRNRERLGSSRNFEEIARRCSGDVIIFSDQDDIWLPGRISRALRVLENEPGLSFVFSDGHLIDEEGARLPGTLFSSVGFTPRERTKYRSGDALAVLLRHNVVTGAALAVRRTSLVRVLPFEPGWLHDYYMALTLEAMGRGAVLEEPLIAYRRHSSQQVGVAGNGALQAFVYAKRQDAAYCQNEAMKFRSLRERLAMLGISPKHPVVLHLHEKERFLEERKEMRTCLLKAPGLFLRALRRGAYERYALGWKQVAVDAIAMGISMTKRR